MGGRGTRVSPPGPAARACSRRPRARPRLRRPRRRRWSRPRRRRPPSRARSRCPPRRIPPCATSGGSSPCRSRFSAWSTSRRCTHTRTGTRGRDPDYSGSWRRVLRANPSFRFFPTVRRSRGRLRARRTHGARRRFTVLAAAAVTFIDVMALREPRRAADGGSTTKTRPPGAQKS